MTQPPGDLPPAPPVLAQRWPDAVDGLTRYAALLAEVGVARGLLGPREVPRLWSRHLLNCAVVADAVPAAAQVVDVGSGAGLPGLVLALVRPDCQVTLLEPLLRRATFLGEAVEELGVGDRVAVVRARAEDATPNAADVVTARAVAPLDRLLGWCLPLVRPGGIVLALKGEQAAVELAAAADVLSRWHIDDAGVREVGADIVTPPTTLVVVRRPDTPVAAAADAPRNAGGSGHPRRRWR